MFDDITKYYLNYQKTNNLENKSRWCDCMVGAGVSCMLYYISSIREHNFISNKLNESTQVLN